MPKQVENSTVTLRVILQCDVEYTESLFHIFLMIFFNSFTYIIVDFQKITFLLRFVIFNLSIF
jgi:hypothetical protein